MRVMVMQSIALALLFGCKSPEPEGELPPEEVAAKPAPAPAPAPASPEPSAIQEDLQIDLGSAAARPLLGEGWAPADEGNDETNWVWGMGKESSLTFRLGKPRPIKMTLKGSPFEFKDAPEQTVTLLVNGTEVGSATLAPGGGEVAVAVGGDLLKEGANTLTLRYAYSTKVSDVIPGNEDIRELAVSWDWLRIEG